MAANQAEFIQSLRILGGVPTDDEVTAANRWADTTGLDMPVAIDTACGTTGRDIPRALNFKAGTTGLDAPAAIAAIVAAATGTQFADLLVEDGGHRLLESGGRRLLETA